MRRHEEYLSACVHVSRVLGPPLAFQSPVVTAATGMKQGSAKVVAIVTAFCPGGRVADFCAGGRSGGRLAGSADNARVLQWAREACDGLRQMHARGLTHRNLNPGNVHLDARGRAVLTGFQSLRNPRAPGDLYSMGRSDWGSTGVASPEVLAGAAPTPAADVWAFGCCLLAWTSGNSLLSSLAHQVWRHFFHV